jgi:hypothetical protein
VIIAINADYNLKLHKQGIEAAQMRFLRGLKGVTLEDSEVRI